MKHFMAADIPNAIAQGKPIHVSSLYAEEVVRDGEHFLGLYGSPAMWLDIADGLYWASQGTRGNPKTYEVLRQAIAFQFGMTEP